MDNQNMSALDKIGELEKQIAEIKSNIVPRPPNPQKAQEAEKTITVTNISAAPVPDAKKIQKQVAHQSNKLPEYVVPVFPRYRNKAKNLREEDRQVIRRSVAEALQKFASLDKVVLSGRGRNIHLACFTAVDPKLASVCVMGKVNIHAIKGPRNGTEINITLVSQKRQADLRRNNG